MADVASFIMNPCRAAASPPVVIVIFSSCFFVFSLAYFCLPSSVCGLSCPAFRIQYVSHVIRVCFSRVLRPQS